MQEEIKVEWKKELNQTYLKIRVPGLYKEDYQMRMIQENIIPNLIHMKVWGEGENALYQYDITGMDSLKTYYKDRRITKEEMFQFLRQIQEMLKDLESYLLDPNRLCLDPEYVFIGEGRFQFCYFPWQEENMRATFHKMMDEFVQWTDYQDVTSVKVAFFLHKETMEENYSLGKIMKQLEEMTKERVREQEQEVKRSQDWITDQEMGIQMMKETDHMWNPIKKFLHKHRKPKWGEWDGVYVDEEELY